ncbi:ionotropic receptor 21a-like [Homarus americanus]|uniref:ionotropic receptor 21a-like n=1 Tax=Homarus americanus TaxID=6706 RepID=UPI001C47F3E5|nr:ionotropic receptor 21a-like [Homarus americanus]
MFVPAVVSCYWLPMMGLYLLLMMMIATPSLASSNSARTGETTIRGDNDFAIFGLPPAPAWQLTGGDTETLVQVLVPLDKQPTPVPPHPQIATPVPPHPQTATSVPSHPQTATPVPSHPQIATPVPPHPQTGTPVPSHPQIATSVPSHPQTATPVPSHPQTATPVPSHPQAATPVPPHPQLSIIPPYTHSASPEGIREMDTAVQEVIFGLDEVSQVRANTPPSVARQKRDSWWWPNEGKMDEVEKEEDETLTRLLTTVVRQELENCALVVAYDLAYHHSRLLDHLLHSLPNSRQVVQVKGMEDLLGMVWVSPLCRGYLLLLHDPVPLLNFVNTADDFWDYNGRFVVVGTSREQLQKLAQSNKGIKTEHLVGLIKSSRAGDWTMYTNSLYGSTSVLRRVASWRRTGTLSTSLNLFPSDKLTNLQGAKLKVSTFEWEPSVLYYRGPDEEVQFLYGIDIEVVNALSRVLNFTVVFEEPPPGEFWGVMNENETWSGMMGRLSRNEADIGVANLFLTLGRLGAVDYSAPYDAEVSCFMVRSDPPAPRWLSLALPFEWVTWMTLLVGLVVTGLLLFCLASLSARCGGEVRSLQSLLGCYFYAFGLHFREPQLVAPWRYNTRIFVSFLWLYTIIITTAYCSNLTAFLTVTRRPQGMDSIRDLYDSGAEVSGLGGFFKGALASAVDPYLQSLAERFVAYQELDVVWPKLRGGRAAYLHNRQFLEFVITTQFTSQGGTSMRIMKECFAPYNIAMALQRHSPLKTKFDRVISWMIESGLVRHWFLESLRLSRKTREKKTSTKADSFRNGKERTNDGLSESGSDVIPLSIDHMQGVFFILIIGQLLSLVVFFIERCCKKSYYKDSP